jgi:aminoglycoside 6'-N-acetyltransferase I
VTKPTSEPIVSLNDVVEAIESTNDMVSAYIHRKTGKIVGVMRDLLDVEEEEESAEGAGGWQAKARAEAREARSSPDFLQLPDAFELRVGDVMRRFCDEVRDTEFGDSLRNAVRGSGAFRRFKAALHRAGQFDRWERYRIEAVEDKVAEWLSAHGIPFSRTEEENGDGSSPDPAAPTIRPATREDADAWLELRRALWPSERKRAHLAEMETFLSGAFDPWPWTALLAFDGSGRAIGFIEVSERPYADACEGGPVAYVEGWFVVPDRRDRGVGRALMAAAEEWGRLRNCVEMGSDSASNNRLSIAAHKALGFMDQGAFNLFRKSLRAPSSSERPARRS